MGRVLSHISRMGDSTVEGLVKNSVQFWNSDKGYI